MDKVESRLALVNRVSDEFHGTLNAFSAIVRVEVLIDDAERAARAHAISPPYAGRDFELDIVSYYSVGLVTCLEWHARSRLADPLTYAPDNVTDDDLGKDAGTKVLRHLIATKARIPQISCADLLYNRWVDFNAPVRHALRRGRLLYLKVLREAIGD
jgi:hypothetical protein